MEKFIREFDLQFVEDIPSRLLCIKCHSILCNPHSVPCGHNYCLNCIVSHLENSQDKRCVGDDNDCKNEELIMTSNVLKNFSIIREIKNVKVNCVLDLCNEKVELINLEEHVNNCRFQLKHCPYTTVGCTENKLNKEDMKQHLYDAVFEHSSIMVNHIRELKNNNNELKFEIENLKKHLMDRQNGMELDIDNLRSTSIEHQNNMELNIENLRMSSLNHRNNTELSFEQIQNQITNLKLSVDEKQNRIEALEVEIQRNKVKMTKIDEVERKMNEQIKFNAKLEKENFSLAKEISNWKTSGDEKQNRIEALEVEIERNKVKVEDVERKLNNKLEKEIKDFKELMANLKKTTSKCEVEMKTVKSFIPNSVLEVNSYDWIVDNYTSKYKAACDDVRTCFESAPFYLRGYRLQLQLFPALCGLYVIIYFKLLGGEYDDLVSWPCPFNLQFSIIDSQNTDFTARLPHLHHSNYTTSNKGESEWERPGDVPQFSDEDYYLCWSGDPMEESNKLMRNDSVKIRTKMIK